MWYYLHNGQQAGPVSKENLQGFLQSQSLPVTTCVWTRGMARWLPANEVPELITGVVGGYLPQPAPGGAYLMTSPSPNGMAIASLVLGVIGVLGAAIFTSLPAIICGHVARRQIRNAAGREGGDGMALTGLILGYLVTLFTLLLISFFILLVSMATSAPAPTSPVPAPVSPVPAPVLVPTVP